MPHIPFDDNGRQRWKVTVPSIQRLKFWWIRHVKIPVMGTTIRHQVFKNSVINASLTKYEYCEFHHCEFVFLEECIIEKCSIYFEGGTLETGNIPWSTITTCQLYKNAPKSA